MTRREIQKKVKQFKRKFGLHKCCYGKLKKATEKQGYTIVEYNHVQNSGSVEALIDSLGLSSYIVHSKGFTYADQNFRMVFLHEDLNEEERIKILAHENGHIYLEHFSTAQIIGKDVQEEYEAHEFAHYLQKNTMMETLHYSFLKHKLLYILGAVLVVSVLTGTIVYDLKAKEKQYHGNYYITTTGNKYHKKQCMFIKDKSSIKRLTEEQFNTGNYEPCAMCLPD